MPPLLLSPIPPSDKALERFFDRHVALLKAERAEEEEQTRLLNSNCSAKELERKGLSIGGLGVGAVSVGLGGKTLVTLVRPLAYHVSQVLPSHTFRGNGDPVRIEPHVPSAGAGASKKHKVKDKGTGDKEGAVEGIVYRVSTESVVVAVDGSKDVDLAERVRLLKLANTVTFDRMDKTIAHLVRIVLASDKTPSTTANNLGLINTLLGRAEPTWAKEIPPVLESVRQEGQGPQVVWYGDRLNGSQKEAIEFCLQADTVACIHGPPGTGKTHTLVELVFQLLSRPANPDSVLPPRILITTPSNLALDNLLLRLHALSKQEPFSSILPPGSILRLGHPTRVHKDLVSETLDYRARNGDDGALVRDVASEIEGHISDLGKKKGERGAVKGKERGAKWGQVRELRKEYREREAKVVKNVVNAARVVLATCHSAGSRQLNNMSFDMCIVDEATQAIEAVCWVPILKSRKLILAGDPQQLPPTVLSRHVKFSKKDKNDTRDEKDDKAEKKTESENKGGSKLEAVTDTHIVGKTENDNDKSDDDDGDDDDDSRKGSLSDSLEEKMAQTGMTRRPTLPPRTLETTLFDRLEKLYGAGIKRVLTVQYRMNENIAAFPSEKLYDSALISSLTVSKHTLLDLPSISDATSEEAKDILEHPVVFFDTAGCEFYEKADGDDTPKKGANLGEGSKSNVNEAGVVVHWAKKLIELGVPPEEIAVVTPYQAQVSLISEMLHAEYPELTVGSVDGLQGQEREAVILSLVRSNPKGQVGFLGEYRRLNVAMTRAKRQLCVVGDSETVGKGSEYLKSWVGWLEDHADVRYAGDL